MRRLDERLMVAPRGEHILTKTWRRLGDPPFQVHSESIQAKHTGQIEEGSRTLRKISLRTVELQSSKLESDWGGRGFGRMQQAW